METREQEAKLQLFLEWLQVNKVELRGCNIKRCDSTKGFGIFSSNNVSDGVLLVVPLDLAISPMRVLQDPILGPECRAVWGEGEVDDRFLMTLFLMVERLRRNSPWKPYLDMLPTTFGNPLWFSDDELQELKGTTLYQATVLQLLKHNICHHRANSIFWSRALNIPLPRSYVFLQALGGPESRLLDSENISGASNSEICSNVLTSEVETLANGMASSSTQEETVWVEGLIPGIDFCNHATWEVDGSGSTTGVPCSMYLLSAVEGSFQVEREVSISYGDKGNEELLYLYGFVMDNNHDDYLMVHYPAEALQNVPFSDTKAQLLQAQKAELRCLLPKSLLNCGFFPMSASKVSEDGKSTGARSCSYSWSGQRSAPSYLDKLVFPENFLTALRTIAMQEDEFYHVSSLLEELVGPEGERQLSDSEVQAAVWEACGDSGAFQLLVDLLQTKMLDLVEGSGTEDQDTELLEKACVEDNLEVQTSNEDTNGSSEKVMMSRNRWSSIVYRRGQKQLTGLFLKEAEHALQLSLTESN
ncbi:hypothetical protein RJ641_016106 [Dillenia turbinata]|uniref:SET domain-containing protein n=1 Tax=Dillenia turbinata TaxID=194707 RepID=A0AAN8V3C1_9MAGN